MGGKSEWSQEVPDEECAPEHMPLPFVLGA